MLTTFRHSKENTISSSFSPSLWAISIVGSRLMASSILPFLTIFLTLSLWMVIYWLICTFCSYSLMTFSLILAYYANVLATSKCPSCNKKWYICIFIFLGSSCLTIWIHSFLLTTVGSFLDSIDYEGYRSLCSLSLGFRSMFSINYIYIITDQTLP